jgi:uncharacterized protein (TIGR02646 family)
MIFVNKREEDSNGVRKFPIPSSLSSQKTKDAFAVIIKEGNYLEEYDGRYKVKDIKETLENIYHKKCAFCEKKLLDTSRAIEHFRPKKANNRIKKCDASFGYYWLAFAWDNLLLACGQCNSPKGSCFDIEHRASYSGQTLMSLQTIPQDLKSKSTKNFRLKM